MSEFSIIVYIIGLIQILFRKEILAIGNLNFGLHKKYKDN